MLCPKCGEDNSDKFRFCGLCGTPLEQKVEARLPAGAPVPNLPRIGNQPEPARSPAPQSYTPPNLDTLRETTFTGLDSFFEPEKPKRGAGRVVLLILLLAALGGASWWTYTNYLAPADKPAPQAPSTDTAATEADKPAIHDAAPSPVKIPVAQEPSPAPAEASPPPAEPKPEPEAEERKAPVTSPPAAQESPAARKPAVKREPLPVKPAPVVAADNGDALFKKGEAYLYGRGVGENCDEAMKYLKAASAKSNAKARSAFGTMYATGHCVPRDLPTSYSWFALALHADPNNQILEKDLSAVWNQMTPPERQMATKMKQ